MVSVDVLLGRHPQVGAIDAVLCIVDASNLERQLFLVSQVLDPGVPTMLVLNMWDVALRRGVTIDVAALQSQLGIPVVTTEAHRLRGIDAVREALVGTLTAPPRPRLFPPAFYDECARLRGTAGASGSGARPVVSAWSDCCWMSAGPWRAATSARPMAG